MQNLKRNDTDELIYETQTQRMNLRLSVREDWEEEIVREFGIDHVHTAIFKMDGQQGPTA